MSANKEIRILLLQECLTLLKLTNLINDKLNKKKYTPDGLSKKLRNNTLKFVEAELIADTLGYEIIFKKKSN